MAVGQNPVSKSTAKEIDSKTIEMPFNNPVHNFADIRESEIGQFIIC